MMSNQIATNHILKDSIRGLFCKYALGFTLAVLCSWGLQAQNAQPKRIEILNADRVQFDAKISAEAQFLVGNVQLMHNEVIMICDSALLYQATNRFEAFGDVEINQGDTLFLFGDSLFYNGNLKQGKVVGDVSLQEKDMELTTDVLLYNVEKSEAYYTTGGRIESKANKNTLTSRKGTYVSKSKMFYFKENVVLVNPDYTVNTDTMDYDNAREIAYFFGPTVIQSDENLLYAENGNYDTKRNQARFDENAFLVSNEQKLTGDSLFYDRNKGIGEVFKQVVITDTVNDFLIYGDYGIYFEKEKKSLVTQQPRAIKLFESDSLYLKADTLFSFEDSLGIKTLLAYHQVSYFKNDLQGVCDTLIYSGKDSSITMLNAPVIWNENNQITGEQIIIYNDGKNPKEMYVNKDAFITQLVDTTYQMYNQIKGRELFGYFTGRELSRVFVSGNGQTIYYIQEDEPDSTKSLIGINKAECSNIDIKLGKKQIESITFLVEPVAKALAIDKLGSSELMLSGLNWRGKERPLTSADVMMKSEVTAPVAKPETAKPQPKRKGKSPKKTQKSKR
ncbi:MAG TPA: OstA-like protein [Luteibaculaceae bacterium]|nr:OstA-like protein [Luteibaculaceae bacterium]